MIKLNKKQRTILALTALYLTAVLAYGIIAAQQGSTRSGITDESIYVNMARSFHYDGNFMRGATPMGYDCILYSIILSVCYFFYTPEGIVTLMRLLSVLIMSSAVFPAYLLSLKILQKTKLALFSAIVSVLFPSMTISYYLYQETLLYPLVIWFLYFLYSTMNSDKYRYQIAAGAFIYALYNTKTICMYILLAYLAFLITDCALNHKKIKRTAINIVLVCASFTAFYVLVRIVINFLNGAPPPASHYDNQLSNSIRAFFDDPVYYLPQALRGTVFYLYYTLLSVAAIPILMPLSSYKTFKNRDKRFLLFCMMAIVAAIMIIVGGIFLLEDSERIPAFHFRYYFPFIIPFIILTLKLDPNSFKISPVAAAGLLALFAFPFVMPEGLSFFSAYVDNYLFPLFMGAAMRLGDNAQILMGILLAGYTACVFLLTVPARKKLLKRSMLCVMLVLFFGVFLVADNYIILNYKNESEHERNVDNDTMVLAEYIVSNEGKSAFIDEHGVYHRAFNYNTRLNEDYFHYYISDATDGLLALNDSVRFIIVPDAMNVTPENCEKIALPLYTVTLYRLNEPGTVSFEYG